MSQFRQQQKKKQGTNGGKTLDENGRRYSPEVIS